MNKNFLGKKGGCFFPFEFNCPFTPLVVVLYPEEDKVRRGIVRQNRGVWWSTVGKYFKRRKIICWGKKGVAFSFQIQLSIYPFSGDFVSWGGSSKKGDSAPKQGGLVEHSGQPREGKEFCKGKKGAAFFLSNSIVHLPLQWWFCILRRIRWEGG